MMHSEEIIDSLLDQVAQLKAERDALLVERQPLSDEQIDALELPESGTGTIRDLVRVIEKAHNIGGAT